MNNLAATFLEKTYQELAGVENRVFRKMPLGRGSRLPGFCEPSRL